ncbi:uncharacterized protein Z519_05112 [Cladophialophora bantiana CBS 173.52]|uniref:Uncharacterized protein n=1 Tax=Cladophialophora bantiana (strain ATCC 10958 / CBS 173.52 / CDC B-1940 / NIH 8579) TaxID=1442370 RepID=A0A0D2G590_CLAB1|nr:uncharacterized protein Z519_05112 [Cladophialophora bantiana CBS 173.52]KIW93797.1 hypothetical protein Z519_05112 [Cladophialophora bantiana CBS 173.52]
MDVENQQQKIQAPEPQPGADSAISQQPAARESMDPSGVSNRVGLRGGGEGEDICCGPDNPDFKGTTGVCDRCRRINWRTIWLIDLVSVNEDLRRSAQQAFEPAPQKHGPVQGIGTGEGTVDAYSNVHWIVPVFDPGEVPAIDSQTCSLCSYLGSLAYFGTDDAAVERWYLGLSTQPLAPRHLYLVGRSRSWQRDTLMRGEILYSEAAISKSTASSTANDIPYRRSSVELDCCLQEIADDNEVTISTANIPDMLLIDYYDRKIVPAPAGAVYMGLSYIWGPKQCSKDPCHPGWRDESTLSSPDY